MFTSNGTLIAVFGRYLGRCGHISPFPRRVWRWTTAQSVYDLRERTPGYTPRLRLDHRRYSILHADIHECQSHRRNTHFPSFQSNGDQDDNELQPKQIS